VVRSVAVNSHTLKRSIERGLHKLREIQHRRVSDDGMKVKVMAHVV